MSDEPSEVTARCPRCGLRVRVSARAQTLVDPVSKCEHKDRWVRCPNLEPNLSAARQSVG
jgi:hypothetical protein